MKLICIISLIIYLNAMMETEAQSKGPSVLKKTSVLENSGISEKEIVKIFGIDATSFPKLKVNIFIDKFCALTGNIKKGSIKVKEDGNDIAIDEFHFTGNTSGQKLDFAVVFDETRSMGEEISAMKSNVQELIDQLSDSGIDTRYALVTFKDSLSIKTNWTSKSEDFKSSVNSLQEKGGDDEPEVSLDAIEAVLAMGFRSDAQKFIVVITDAHAHYEDDGSNFSKYRKEDVERDLIESGIIFIPISPTFDDSSPYVDLRNISNNIQSTWIDINSGEFSVILERIQGILTGTYVIEYSSADLTPSDNRTVFISVDELGCVDGSDSSSYITPGTAPIELRGAFSISGRIFDDINGDGIKSIDERGLEGWDILLEGPNEYSTTSKSDRRGYYIFTGLPAGSYILDAVAQDNWEATNSSDGFQMVELVDTHESDIDFGFRLPLSNQPPEITNLVVEPKSPQDIGAIITWIANATDPEDDSVRYRFFLNDEAMTDWIMNDTWTWTPSEAGSFRIEVRVRDTNHAGPNGLDDRRVESFIITEPKPIAPENQPPIINDLVAAQESVVAITWTTTANDPENDPILYRLFLNDKLVADWTTSNKWTLNINEINFEENKIEVQVRDGKHEGPEGYDYAKFVQFSLSSMKSNILKKWIKTFGGSNTDVGRSVQQTSDGGYIVSGITSSYGAGDKDIWLIKADSSGNRDWDVTFGGSEYDRAFSVQQTNDGGYVIAGETSSYGAGGVDIWLIKADSSGNKEWDKTFGKENDDGAYSVQQTSDGGFIIVGSVGYANGYDVCLIKTDADGNLLWDKTFSGSGYASGISVQQTGDGGYIIAGDRDSCAWIIKTDSSGNEEWNKILSEWEEGDLNSVQQTDDGGYVIAGSFSGAYESDGSDIWLIKTDAYGNELWERTFGGLNADTGYSVQQTNDGGYIITGSTWINGGTANSGNWNMYAWLIKTDDSGNMIWDKVFGESNIGVSLSDLQNLKIDDESTSDSGTSEDGTVWGTATISIPMGKMNSAAYSVQQTSDDGYILVGETSSFGPGSGENSYGGGGDVWLIKTDAYGDVI
jgi:hypothetical protein